MTTLQQFNEAKSNNNWEKAQEIIEKLCRNSETGENDPENGERGRLIAEYLNAQDAAQETAKRRMKII